MIQNNKEIMQQALEFVEFLWRDVSLNEYAEEKRKHIEKILEDALAQPEPVQEPHQIRNDFEQRMIGIGASPTALSRLKSGEYLSPSIQAAWDAEKKKYTAPPQRKPLTDEEIIGLACDTRMSLSADYGKGYVSIITNELRDFARAIERAHGIVS